MEVEAKFSVPDRETLDQLWQLKDLAGYRLMRCGVKLVHDRYLDTEDRAIFRAGYACRLRHKGNAKATYLATLKGLGGADAASGIHQREEHEVQVGEIDPLTWPDSPARELALRLTGGQQLRELFSLSQERHIGVLCDETQENVRQVIELSLDVVTVGGDATRSYLELELELLEQGNELDLHAIAVGLRAGWSLQPELRSKFERGLELVDAQSVIEREGGVWKRH
jgi:inorganic triphosphatase YgiF